MASILVVDDQALVRNLFDRVLKAEGHEVTLCENGQQGYEAAMKTAFDLIFTDHNMPFLGGIEMIEMLRNSEGPNRTTPMLMASSDATPERKQKAKEAGATGWITKPVPAEKILKLAEAVLPK